MRRKVPDWRIGPAVVLIAGLLVTAALAAAAYVGDRRNESRLLDLQVEQTATVLQLAIATVQTPLVSAAELASTGGSSTSFQAYLEPYVGEGKTFRSISLWTVDGTGIHLQQTVGETPQLADDPAAAQEFLTRAASSRTMTVRASSGAAPQLGYAYAGAAGPTTWVVYAESALPADRRVPVQRDSPYADLRFALYLGSGEDNGTLLETNSDELPIRGQTSTVSLPFGGSHLTLVAASTGKLGGSLAARLWWIVAIAGGLLTLIGVTTAQRLTRQRSAAERLTRDIDTLLSEQRGIAESLQHALLPRDIPEVDGLDIAVRYIPGVNGVDIGGDWYELIPLGERRLFFVIGDVSGRGIEAGAVMASLRFAIRGFISEGHPPEAVLSLAARLIDVSRDNHFATVLCGILAIDTGQVTIASAGHLPPLVIAGEQTTFAPLPDGPPLGVLAEVEYRPSTFLLPAGGILLAYTDGLVERRDESLSAGLDRLTQAASLAGTSSETPTGTSSETLVSTSSETLIGTVLERLKHTGEDDTAVLAIRRTGAG